MHNGTAGRPQNLTRLLELLWEVVRQRGVLTLTAADLPADQDAEIEFDTNRVAFRPDLTLAEFAESICHELFHARRGPAFEDEADAEEIAVEQQAQALLYNDAPLRHVIHASGQTSMVTGRPHLVVLQGGS